MPNYYDEIRHLKSTIERFEKTRDEYRAEAEATTDECLKYRKGYSAWVVGRRLANFRYFLECQEAGRHEVAIVYRDKLVCTCGLITDLLDDHPDSRALFAGVDGHLEH